MQSLLLGFCGSALSLAAPWPHLAAWRWTVLAAGAALLGVALWRRRRCAAQASPAGAAARRLQVRCCSAACGLVIGAVWSGWVHERALALRLDHVAAGGATPLVVLLASAPETLPAAAGRPGGQRFLAVVRAGPAVGGRPTRGIRLRLTWYGAPPLARGEVWRLQVALKGPWGYANPGGFDYERWLLGKDIQATGWVRTGTRLAPATPGAVERLRARVTAALTAAGLDHAGIVQALLLGRSDGIDQATWDVLRATGTVHLMVISGLHVSLAAALGFLLGAWGCRLCPPLLLWLDARHAGCLAGLAAGAAYVTLAGAGLPAQRALLMSAAVLMLLAGGRTGQVAHLLLLALTGVVAVQPLAVHQQGFWLSFAAVAMLLLALGKDYGRRRRVAALVRLQLVMSLGLLPLVALSTGAIPAWSVPANLLAVPLISLVVVPCVLLGGLAAVAAPDLAVWPLCLADKTLDVVLAWLGWLGQVPAAPVTAASVTLVVAQIAALALVLGSARRHVPVLAGCGLLALVGRSTGIPAGEYRVTALDVGQGSAIIVDTRSRRLLYDAGPGFPSGFETGTAVVVPSLAATGPYELDTLVLSHDDIDHVGGAGAIRRLLGPRRVLAGSAGSAAPSCHGRAWRWDEVEFRILEARRPPAAADNDWSCVLLIDNGVQATVLGGDISAVVEAEVMRLIAHRAPLALLFAPHHGSASSSSRAWTRVLRPRQVFVSAARGNRFGHPHPAVVSRYRSVGAELHQTGVHGALIWSSRAPHRVVRWRRDAAPYWRAAAPSRLARRRSR